MKISFEIPMIPRGQARSRASRRGTFIHMHKDPNQEDDENKILACSLPHRPREPLAGELTLTVRAFFPVPKSRPKWWKAQVAAGEIRPTSKPDLSNIIKHIEDAFNGVFWLDDSQIVGYGASTGKYYAPVPHYEIEILENSPS